MDTTLMPTGPLRMLEDQEISDILKKENLNPPKISRENTTEYLPKVINILRTNQGITNKKFTCKLGKEEHPFYLITE